MVKGIKICGVSDLETLNYILNHKFPPKFVGFICNYKKSRRYVEYKKLKELVNIKKKETSFVAVLVDPNDKVLEEIKELNFDRVYVSSQPNEKGMLNLIKKVCQKEKLFE